MSTWVCNDFDEPFEQSFTISRMTSFDSLRIKCLKSGIVNSTATFNFQITQDDIVLFNQTIAADFINTNLPDNGDRADLVFEIDSFVLNPDIEENPVEYVLKFSSSNYTTGESTRFMICRRQEDDVAITINGTFSNDIKTRALQMPIFFEIFKWSKDSKE